MDRERKKERKKESEVNGTRKKERIGSKWNEKERKKERKKESGVIWN